MRSMKQYIRSVVLLGILIIAGLIKGTSSDAVMLSGGILLVMAAFQNISEKENKSLYAVQFLFSVIFAYFGVPVLSPLCFYEFRINKKLQLFLPGIMCMINAFIFKKTDFPHSLMMTLCIFAFSALLLFIDISLDKYDMSSEKIKVQLEKSAVSELYEKKLNRELMMKNYLADRNARLEERENISRNIHNSVGHSITAAIMTLDAADMLFDMDKDKAREKVKAANERMRSGLESVRQAVRVLGDDDEPVRGEDMKVLLNEAADSFIMDTSIKASFDSNLPEDLLIPHEHAEFLTGALKELLTNGVRHGHADKFFIILQGDTTHISLSVTDNGTGDFNEKNRSLKIKTGFGLKKIISYTEKCGGRTTFHNTSGFHTEITLPLGNTSV